MGNVHLYRLEYSEAQGFFHLQHPGEQSEPNGYKVIAESAERDVLDEIVTAVRTAYEHPTMAEIQEVITALNVAEQIIKDTNSTRQ